LILVKAATAALGFPVTIVHEEAAMLTWEDCVALCELSEGEIHAIAAHERIPEMLAAELGNYLVHRPGGVKMIRRMILDDMLAARLAGDRAEELKLKAVLRHFVEHHRPAPAPALPPCCCA
jgi:hypothetical protein